MDSRGGCEIYLIKGGEEADEIRARKLVFRDVLSLSLSSASEVTSELRKQHNERKTTDSTSSKAINIIYWAPSGVCVAYQCLLSACDSARDRRFLVLGGKPINHFTPEPQQQKSPKRKCPPCVPILSPVDFCANSAEKEQWQKARYSLALSLANWRTPLYYCPPHCSLSYAQLVR